MFTRNVPVHNRRRNVWSRALSTKGSEVHSFIVFQTLDVFDYCTAITSYQDRIKQQIRVLLQTLSEDVKANRPVEMNKVLYWYAFDAMGEFAFSKDFGMMRRRKGHRILKWIRGGLSILGPFSPVMWLIRIGFACMPLMGTVSDWGNIVAFCRKQLESRVEVIFTLKFRGIARTYANLFVDAY